LLVLKKERRMTYLTKVSKLSLREKKLWNLVRNKSGVVMAYGIPGISKSATFKSIAEKMGLNYIDLRASTMDETDLGVFPTISDIDGIKVVDHAVPAWAVEANKKPSLIHFEELNRCSSNVRNAVLGILLERIIGAKFKFNEHVYMVASGNPLCDHDSDIEAFGFALRNRLIPVQFELTLKQWISEYAEENVIPEVIGFLKTKPDYFGNTQFQLDKFISEDNMTQYPSPRSWTFLSDYIKGFDSKERSEAMQELTVLKSFVGELPANAFVNYIKETFKVNVDDVLNGKVDLNTLDNMTVQRITQEFQDSKVLHELKTKEVKNWEKFIDIMSDEIRAGHISTLAAEISGLTSNQKEVYKKVIVKYKDITNVIINSIS